MATFPLLIVRFCSKSIGFQAVDDKDKLASFMKI